MACLRQMRGLNSRLARANNPFRRDFIGGPHSHAPLPLPRAVPKPTGTPTTRRLFSSASGGANVSSESSTAASLLISSASVATGLAIWSMYTTAAPKDANVVQMEAVQPASISASDLSKLCANRGGPIIPKAGKPIQKLKIFIGYDSREDIAYQVARHSILKHATCDVEVVPISQAELRAAGLYKRERDPTESTEFSFTRFLTPYLAGYDGWAMFVDCDFLYTDDIRKLGELLDDRYAVMCVQHNYNPKTSTKMDGAVQTKYPRKNWSSMVLYNASHPKNRVLTPEVVSSQSGAFLHRFQWLDEKDIGNIPETWNWLCGHCEAPADGLPPKAVHYTLGGPWFPNWVNVEYGKLWIQEADEYRQTALVQKILQDDIMKAVDKLMNDRISPLESQVHGLLDSQRESSAVNRMMLLQMGEK